MHIWQYLPGYEFYIRGSNKTLQDTLTEYQLCTTTMQAPWGQGLRAGISSLLDEKLNEWVDGGQA